MGVPLPVQIGQVSNLPLHYRFTGRVGVLRGSVLDTPSAFGCHPSKRGASTGCAALRMPHATHKLSSNYFELLLLANAAYCII